MRHGRVYPGKSTWTQARRRWLAGQCFDNANSELAYLDYLAAVDGLVARRCALDERLSRVAVEGTGRAGCSGRCSTGRRSYSRAPPTSPPGRRRTTPSSSPAPTSWRPPAPG
jgi:hypothetical protein